MTPARIAELRTLAAAATPGPWAWFGNLTTHEVYLATVKRGRVYVMDFVRWGMTGAAPRFQCEHIMERVDKFAVREVPYRGHFNEIDHPDARYIAAACNELPAALDEIERLTRELREARAAIRAFGTPCEQCGALATTDNGEASLCDDHRVSTSRDTDHAPAIRAAEKEGGE